MYLIYWKCCILPKYAKWYTAKCNTYVCVEYRNFSRLLFLKVLTWPFFLFSAEKPYAVWWHWCIWRMFWPCVTVCVLVCEKLSKRLVLWGNSEYSHSVCIDCTRQLWLLNSLMDITLVYRISVFNCCILCILVNIQICHIDSYVVYNVLCIFYIQLCK